MVMVDGRSFMMGQFYSISEVIYGLSLLTFKGSVFCFRDSISQFFCLFIGLVCKLVTLLSISLLHVYSKALARLHQAWNGYAYENDNLQFKQCSYGRLSHTDILSNNLVTCGGLEQMMVVRSEKASTLSPF